VKSSISQRTGGGQFGIGPDSTTDAIFSGQIMAAEPLRGGAVFRWESTSAGILILAALGAAVAPPPVTRHLETLGQLCVLSEPTLLVGYRGCDKLKHYFVLPACSPCSIPLEQWSVSAMPVELGFCIPLIFQGERLAIPPAEWSLGIELVSLQWAIDC
jgi:hypothetical protein